MQFEALGCAPLQKRHCVRGAEPRDMWHTWQPCKAVVCAPAGAVAATAHAMLLRISFYARRYAPLQRRRINGKVGASHQPSPITTSAGCKACKQRRRCNGALHAFFNVIRKLCKGAVSQTALRAQSCSAVHQQIGATARPKRVPSPQRRIQ